LLNECKIITVRMTEISRLKRSNFSLLSLLLLFCRQLFIKQQIRGYLVVNIGMYIKYRTKMSHDFS